MFSFRRTKRLRERRTPRAHFWRQCLFGGVVLLAFGIVIFAVYHGTRIPAFTIQDVSVSGGTTIPTDDVRAAVQAELRGTYWRIIPRSFSLFYPHERIARALSAYPRIANPQIERDGFTRLVIQFGEYVPHALLCSRDGEISCFFVDAEGFAFEEVTGLSGGTLVRFIDQNAERIVRGDRIPADRLNAAESFIEDAARDMGFRIGTVIYTASGDDIEFHINGGGVFKVNSAHGLDRALSDIRTIVSTEEYAHLRPGNFQYIDVRFPPKVFVQEALPQPATTTDEIGTTTPSVDA